MGKDIEKTEFSNNDFIQFHEKLEEQLTTLKMLIEKGKLSNLPKSIGAELEVYIVNKHGYPLAANEKILSQARDPQLATELNRYNLEYNLSPYNISNQPFFSLEKEITQKLKAVNEISEEYNANVVPIGILPTLRRSDFGEHCLTNRKRYHALVKQLTIQRGKQFEIDIDGPDPLKLNMADITLEGANTSFQIHYRTSPDEYVDLFNAIQFVTPMVLAISANSPSLFGHQLWDETRIPLFKQSIDTRKINHHHWNEPARVNYGNGWLRQTPYELFNEAVHLYPALLPIEFENETYDGVNTPKLPELCLHQGTVWMWNRPVYDHNSGGHLRIEMRSLPSGPSAVDMIANSVFLIGLAEAYSETINDVISSIPFPIAEYNFYRSAQHSIDSSFAWPNLKKAKLEERKIIDIIEEHLTIAESGLSKIGISQKESSYYLNIIENRIQSRMNGAKWQILTYKKQRQRHENKQALHKMLNIYIKNSLDNIPVHKWPIKI